MILPVGENFRIRSDSRQWIVEQRHVPKKQDAKNPDPYWSPEAYYSTVESAAVGLYELRLRLSEAEGWREATEAAKAIARELQEALSPHLRLLPKEVAA